jgi:hypothetical protein
MSTSHPIFRLLLARPELLVEHASAYGELLRAELLAAGTAWQRRLRLQMLAGGALLAGVVLLGQAAMWLTVLPDTRWLLLLAVPALPLLVGAWAWWRLVRPEQPGTEAWTGLSRQLSADLTLICDTRPAP